MSDTMHALVRNTFAAIGISLAIYCAISCGFEAANGGTVVTHGYFFARGVAASLLIALGFSVPSIVYYDTRMAQWLQVAIHMGIGCTTMVAAMRWAGWLPDAASPTLLLSVGASIAAAFLIGLCFMVHEKKAAAKMNERIDELKRR